ncbi:MAG: hypothetical protein H3C43_04620 [Leptonema sp. (in: Bacteria)]|nr:hypothetical protein [Leptonema sp. (in: bacteria)]
MARPNLHIFLGAGGVGKTTLSASLAIHLAFQGRKVGLLSIDPAKRLKTALGADNIDESGQIFWRSKQNQGELRAAVLSLPDSLRRWISDEGLDNSQLFEHPLYVTVAEKIASATETLAPIRMAEWIEQYPDTDDLIIDTAPGLHAVDFLIRPDRLLAFFDSKIIEWLKWFAGGEDEDSGLIQKIVRGGAKGILNALGKVGGENILLALGELILMMDKVIFRMVDRLEEARHWIRDNATDIAVICSLRHDSVSVAAELARILTENQLPNCRILLNRSIPESFFANNQVKSLFPEPTTFNSNMFDDFESLYQKYLESSAYIRQSIVSELPTNITELPVFAGLEQVGELRLEELDRLGSLVNQTTMTAST